MTTAEAEAGVTRPTLAEVLAGGNREGWIRSRAGFWTRMLAFGLDLILFGWATRLFAWLMPSTVYALGPWGLPAGTVAALLYFGVMNSRIGGGQTIGKRLMKIAVRSTDGTPIGIGRSILRTSIWLIPMRLNEWQLPLFDNSIVSTVVNGLILVIGTALLATILFDQGNGRRLDDMLTHSYVAYLRGDRIESLPPLARRQWIAAGAAGPIAIIVVAGLVLGGAAKVPAHPTDELERTLREDSRFFTVEVSDSSVTDGLRKTKTLNIDAWHKGVPSEAARTLAMNDIARKALTLPEVNRYDLIRIDIRSAYDFGFATSSHTNFDSEPVETWMDRVRPPTTVAVR